MNIFVLDESPYKAAELQCDKHVVKMIVETAQLLSTAHRMLDGHLTTVTTKSGRKGRHYALDDDREDALYKACHFNHPSAVWAREDYNNYVWLYQHFRALCNEYTYRYGKTHATETKLSEVLSKAPNNIPLKERTPFKLAMGNEPQCINIDNPVASYRAYYRTKKDRFKMAWTHRDVPAWFA